MLFAFAKFPVTAETVCMILLQEVPLENYFIFKNATVDHKFSQARANDVKTIIERS